MRRLVFVEPTEALFAQWSRNFSSVFVVKVSRFLLQLNQEIPAKHELPVRNGYGLSARSQSL